MTATTLTVIGAFVLLAIALEALSRIRDALVIRVAPFSRAAARATIRRVARGWRYDPLWRDWRKPR